MRRYFKNILSILCMLFVTSAFCAVDQILNGIFFQNPAELNAIQQAQLIGGNVYIVPTLKFIGTTALGQGAVQSRVQDNLPYVLAADRLTERFVIGINISPSAYGHLNWPVGSIVETSSTTTKLLYYRFGMQASYQILDNLAVGLGLNVEYNKIAELDFVIAGLGNQINKISGKNFIGDLGLYYRINAKNYITAAVYSPVNTFGFGSSTLGSTRVNNFSLNIIDAAVAYIGLQHTFTNKWNLEGKVYWSGWSIEKKVDFINTTTGSFSTPAYWDDVWSFQLISRYVLTEKLAVLGGLIYDTNPVSKSMNQIGYPLASAGAISLGVDLDIQQGISAQLIYGYGAFIPKAMINNSSANGLVSASFQSLGLQFMYKK